jgi:HKD family nuclease
VDLAVAFVSHAGISRLLPHLLKPASRRGVRILTGLYQQVTEPKALRTLLKAQKGLRGFETRIFIHEKFHQKEYLLFRAMSVTAIIGSSNLTDEGLHSESELNAILSLPIDHAFISSASNGFERNWFEKSVPLEQVNIELYERKFNSAAAARKQIESIPHAAIVGRKLKAEIKAEANRPKRFWRASIEGILSKRSSDVINQEITSWDDRYYIFSEPSQRPYERGDRIVMFDFPARAARIVEVLEHTSIPRSLPIPSDEGRNVIAYRPVRGFRKRRFSKRFWVSAKAGEVVANRNSARKSKELSPRVWQKIIRFFRV